MNYNENIWYTSIQCGLLLSMYMDSTCYTIMYNSNSGMYHEPRHEHYYTGNTVIFRFLESSIIKQYINGTLVTKYFGDLCCKISINVSTSNVNMPIDINMYLVVHECLKF